MFSFHKRIEYKEGNDSHLRLVEHSFPDTNDTGSFIAIQGSK